MEKTENFYCFILIERFTQALQDSIDSSYEPTAGHLPLLILSVVHFL